MQEQPQIKTHGSGQARSIHVRHNERCAVCDETRASLGDHHIFGRTIPIKIRCCVQCHADFHREVDTLCPGPVVAAMFRRLADVFTDAARRP